MKWDQTTTAWVILGTALFQPVYANQGQGQLYLLLAVLTLWGWIGYRRQNEALLGAALAGLLLLKLAGLFLWPLLLGQKRWCALLWGGGTSLVIGLLTLPWLTWASWLTHLRFILVSPSAPERAATAYQGFNGLIRHLFGYDPIYSPEPLLLSPMLARWLPVFVLGLMLVVTLWLGAKAKGADGPFMAAVVGVIASPLALDYHYVLLLLPLMVMGSVFAAANSLLVSRGLSCKLPTDCLALALHHAPPGTRLAGLPGLPQTLRWPVAVGNLPFPRRQRK